MRLFRAKAVKEVDAKRDNATGVRDERWRRRRRRRMRRGKFCYNTTTHKDY